jgi:hypothetical protein
MMPDECHRSHGVTGVRRLSPAAGRSRYAPAEKHVAPRKVPVLTIEVLSACPVVRVNDAIAENMKKIDPM